MSLEETNSMEITLADCFSGIKKHWKRIVVFSLIFALLGATIGFIIPAKNEVYAGADKLPQYEEAFHNSYTSKVNDINSYYGNLIIYANTVKMQIIPDDDFFDHEQIEGLLFKIEEYNSSLATINNYIDLYQPLYYRDKENQQIDLNAKINKLEQSIAQAKIDRETLSYIAGTLPIGTAMSQESLDDMLMNIYSLGKNENQLKLCKEQLQSLNVNAAEAQKNIKVLDTMIADAISALEALNDEAYVFAESVAKEYGIYIAAGYDVDKTSGNSFAVVIIPGQNASSGRVWAATAVVGLILGLIGSGYMSIYKFAKNKEQ